jgi:hypothetical protein
VIVRMTRNNTARDVGKRLNFRVNLLPCSKVQVEFELCLSKHHVTKTLEREVDVYVHTFLTSVRDVDE